MCGIVGYVGSQTASDRPLEVVLEGLRRLEYRGYDSAGVALVSPGGELETAKKAGKLANLVEELDAHPLDAGTAAIGHTRWATHGGPTDVNAHPHVSGGLALIHNGIVENFATLKAELVAQGVEFTSETDTEVAAHLVARAYDRTGDLTQAVTEVARTLHGTFTLLAVHADGVIVTTWSWPSSSASRVCAMNAATSEPRKFSPSPRPTTSGESCRAPTTTSGASACTASSVNVPSSVRATSVRACVRSPEPL